MKKLVTFKDAEHKKVTAEIKIENGRFSMSGEYGGSLGQVFNHIKPANDAQKKLVDLWKKWHLNDMSAGTEKQASVLKKYREDHKNDYTKICKILDTVDNAGELLNIVEAKQRHELRSQALKEVRDFKEKIDNLIGDMRRFASQDRVKSSAWYIVKGEYREIFTAAGLELKDPGRNDGEKRARFYNFPKAVYDDMKKIESYRNSALREMQPRVDDALLSTLLYDKHPETGNPYKYGSGWLKRELPADIKELVEEIVAEIEDIENERRGETLVKDMDYNEAYRIIEDNMDCDDPDAVIALAIHEGLNITEAVEDITDEGDYRYDVQGIYYLCGTDHEMDEAVRDDIFETIWAFNASFLSGHMPDGITEDVIEVLQEKCESANEGLRRMIVDENKFVSDAVAADGRGHFLNRYDGSENTVDVNGETYYIYRS